ncbi:MAG: hypothetical protein K0R77_2068 [Chryseobacterium sp.]|uniref:hypothetical protein n=1 Tax=Chryseobacterium sp. TaxID=1871047 RepID=UPI00260EB153|nr:hypothetical protein [Chryseobacterium sp.]MDF2552793.1 hypothetical protein [Chryseobacterium sp.]
MKIYLSFLLILNSMLYSQRIIHPEYICDNVENVALEKTEDIHFFYYKQIQYIGTIREKINVSYNDSERYSDILENNYKKTNNDSLNKEFKERHYDNIKIFVDTNTLTPLIQTKIDYSKITEAEVEAEVDKINDGQASTKEIPQQKIYYDGFPVTIYNLETRERIIGFGNNVAIELEALGKDNLWKKIYNFRKYNCGTGIRYIALKPNEIATVFEPRIIGNFKTKFRYRLGNIISNEFEGSINDNYLNELKE